MTTPEFTVSVRRFRWGLRVEEPWKITDGEEMRSQSVTTVMARCHQQVARASFMVNGPNREVYWWVEEYNILRHDWREICRGRSKVKDRPLGNRAGLQ